MRPGTHILLRAGDPEGMTEQPQRSLPPSRAPGDDENPAHHPDEPLDGRT
jgi:hypothetical protein